MALNRPPVNIINIETMVEMSRALDELAEDKDLKLLILSGGAAKGFSAGVDVGDHTEDRVAEMLSQFHAAALRIYRMEAITLAAVHGFALGGGLELVAVCDLIVAAEGVKFGNPEIKVGVFPPVSAVLLPGLIGDRKAAELLLTGEPIDAKEAHRLGFINRVVPADRLEAEVEGLVRSLMEKSPVILKLTKKAMTSTRGLELASALSRTEDIYLKELMITEDAREGLAAFMEKRPPAWKGR